MGLKIARPPERQRNSSQRSAVKPTAPCFSFVDVRFAGALNAEALPLVVLKGESQLLDGPVASRDRGNAMAAEVVTRVLHV